MYQGWTFPVPEDDMESCEGHESPILTISSEENSFDDADRLTAVHPPQLVCRADTGSDQHCGFSATLCAGDIAQQPADQYTRELFPTFEREHSTTGRQEHNTQF